MLIPFPGTPVTRACRIVAFLAAIATVGPFASSQILTQGKTPAFAPGEKLTYDVLWSIFNAGEVSATLNSIGSGPQDAYEVVTTAYSQGFVSLLYNVQNELHSRFDPETACSQSISKTINEGRRHKETKIVFDSGRKLAVLDERDLSRPKDPPKHAENEIPPCVQDVVTAFYFLRRQNFQVGKSIKLPVNDGSKTYEVTVEVQAREPVQTPLGNREAFRVEPKVFGGLFKRKGRMLIWFSDDPQHVPLRIKFFFSLGTITGTLRSVSQQTAATPAPG